MSHSKSDTFIPFADVQKTFGRQGELLIKWWTNAPAEINLKEPVFIMIDGLPVPFYFKTLEARGNSRSTAVFEDFETKKLAEELVGKQLRMKEDKQHVKNNAADSFLHYKVIDQLHGELGVVTDFLDIPQNPCLQIASQGRELIIPFNKAIVLKIDRKKQQMETLLPEGLLEL